MTRSIWKNGVRPSNGDVVQINTEVDDRVVGVYLNFSRGSYRIAQGVRGSNRIGKLLTIPQKNVVSAELLKYSITTKRIK